MEASIFPVATWRFVMILQLISYVGMVFGFLLMVFTISAGLYYTSEFIEENTVFSKKIMVRLICTIIAAHVLLMIFDGFPFWETVFAVIANSVYLQTMRRFPMIHLTDISFILGCVCAIINHFFWASYFSNDSLPPYSARSEIYGFNGKTHPPFREIASFLGLLVWFVPLLLFVSLTAGDNVLPTANPNMKIPRKRRGLAKQWVEYLWSFFGRRPNYEQNIY